jgi:hypothetical protein
MLETCGPFNTFGIFRLLSAALVTSAIAVMAGCDDVQVEPPAPAVGPAPTVAVELPTRPAVPDEPARPASRPPSDTVVSGHSPPQPSQQNPQPEPERRPNPRREPERRSLADLLTEDELHGTADPGFGMAPMRPELLRPPMEVDDKAVAREGVRKLQSKHLTLYTDIPSSPGVDELPAVFDKILPQWCDYFGLDATKHQDFHLTGYAIGNRQLFRRLGLLPDDLPPFLHGYSRDREFWLYDQSSDYYRRHLVLHEGTHGIMYLLLGGYGPPWYMEGMAELFGTHLWADSKLTTRYFPQTKEEVPYWGRVKIIKDEYAAGRGMMLDRIMEYGPRAHLNKEPYAWCWAAAKFLDEHPLSREKFRQCGSRVRSFDFNKQLRKELADVWPKLSEQWQLFVANMEYGYDIQREVIQYAPGESLPPGGTTVTVAADRGWQSSGIRLEAGTRYEITATGRFQIADQPEIWWCEPNGVTIRYWNGKPLGILRGVIRDDVPDVHKPSELVSQTMVIGLRQVISPPQSGTLYLRVNDSPAELADNAGQLTVHVAPH